LQLLQAFAVNASSQTHIKTWEFNFELRHQPPKPPLNTPSRSTCSLWASSAALFDQCFQMGFEFPRQIDYEYQHLYQDFSVTTASSRMSHGSRGTRATFWHS